MVLIINIIAVFCCICVLAWPAFLNIVCYPFSKKICVKISDHIVRKSTPSVFRILKVYKKFKLSYFSDNFDKLPEQFFVICNHQSLFDIPIFMTFFNKHDVRFVAKDSLSRHIPLVSEMLRSHEHCMIPRKGGAGKAMKTMEDFSNRVIERNQIPILFPEGTRSKDGSLGTFYSAGFRKISEITKLPVVVCCLDNGYKINDLFHIFENISNIDYKVKILKIYPAPDSKEAQIKILEEAKDLMEEQLNIWRQEDAKKNKK